MKHRHRIVLMTLCVLSALSGCATDKSFLIPRSRFDKEVTSIAVLPCENQVASSIDESKQAYLAWADQVHKSMNNGFNSATIPGSSAVEVDAEAKAWSDRFEGKDRPFVLRCLEIADSAMIASLSAAGRFTLTSPAQCAKVKKDVFVENRILTRADTLDLAYDPVRKKTISDTFIIRLPGDAVMNMSLRCDPSFQDKKGFFVLKVIIMSKTRTACWEKWVPLADIDSKTDLEDVLRDGAIEKAIADMAKAFKR